MVPKTHDTVPWLDGVPPEELRRIVDVLYRVHRFIAAITDLDTLLERIMEESKSVAQAEACSLMLYDARSQELYFEVALGETGDQQTLKREVRLKLGQGIAGAAALARESINVTDVSQDGRFYASADEMSQFRTRSLLAVPLVDRDELVGVLELLNKIGGEPFTETDLRVMEMFSGLVATVIANARLIEENLRAARLAAVGQAVAGLSHYAKNIIAGMGGSVDLVDQGLKQGQTEVLQRSWPVLRRSTRRIADLVENMLAYSKERRPVRMPCTVRSIVNEVLEMFWGLQVHKQIAIDVDLDRAQGIVMVDQAGIVRCLLNLLVNAADTTPGEAGKIWVTAERPASGEVWIDVADNGPGVEPGLREAIFDLFFSTKGSKGTGIGLAVTRKIAREHGGDVLLMDRAGGGALFRIVLPQQSEERLTVGEEES